MKHDRQNESRARQMAANMTPWEGKLWFCYLKDYPIRFQKQKCIGHFIVDFYCFRAKLVIELDGGGHYEPDAQRKDEWRTRELERLGLKIIRFCNTDVDKNFRCVCDAIDQAVKERI